MYCDGDVPLTLREQSKGNCKLAVIFKLNELPSSWTPKVQERERKLCLAQLPEFENLLRLALGGVESEKYALFRTGLTILLASTLLGVREDLQLDGWVVVQCDPSYEEIAKYAMNLIFGFEQHSNSIALGRGKHSAVMEIKQFVREHDTLLVYARSTDSKFASIMRPGYAGYAEGFDLVDDQAQLANGVYMGQSPDMGGGS